MCAATWGYGSDNGPSVWVKDFPKAGGKRQSPINIDQKSAKSSSFSNVLKVCYAPEASMTVTNNGFTFVAVINGDNSIYGGPLEKTSYKLHSFHFHWGSDDSHGSEHTIDNQAYPAELHLVHWNNSKYPAFPEAAAADGGLCVLGIMLKVGDPNAAIQQLCDAMAKVKEPSSKFTMEKSFDLPGLLPEDITKFYTYPGSLTTPPCHESVTWVVCKEFVTCSKEQFEAFRCLTNQHKDPLVNNFRPVISLGDRTVCCSE